MQLDPAVSDEAHHRGGREGLGDRGDHEGSVWRNRGRVVEIGDPMAADVLLAFRPYPDGYAGYVVPGGELGDEPGHRRLAHFNLRLTCTKYKSTVTDGLNFVQLGSGHGPRHFDPRPDRQERDRSAGRR